MIMCNEAGLHLGFAFPGKKNKGLHKGGKKELKKKKNQPEHFYSAFFPVGDKLDCICPPPMQTLSFVSVGYKWHDFAFLPAWWSGWSKAVGLCGVGQLGEMLLALLILSFSFKVSCTSPCGKEGEDGGFAQTFSVTVLFFGNLGISLKAFVSCSSSDIFFSSVSFLSLWAPTKLCCSHSAI